MKRINIRFNNLCEGGMECVGLGRFRCLGKKGVRYPIGIKDNDLAYVFWSGDPEIDSELQYTSHLIANHKTKKISGGKFWLNNDKDIQEYLILYEGALQKYYIRYSVRGKSREIQYTLTPVRRGSLPSFRMNYPGNK